MNNIVYSLKPIDQNVNSYYYITIITSTKYKPVLVKWTDETKWTTPGNAHEQSIYPSCGSLLQKFIWPRAKSVSTNFATFVSTIPNGRPVVCCQCFTLTPSIHSISLASFASLDHHQNKLTSKFQCDHDPRMRLVAPRRAHLCRRLWGCHNQGGRIQLVR